MRILHINCNYIGTALHQLMVEKLDEYGCNNQVYVPTYNKDLSVIEPNQNVIVSECFKKWDRILFDYKQWKIYKDIQPKLNISTYDCIHAYTLFTDGNCARRLSKKYKIPYVVAIRNTDVNDFFAKMIHLRNRGIKVMRDAKAIFFLSESYRKQVFDKYVPKRYKEDLLRKSHIITNGIDDFWFENMLQSADPSHINRLRRKELRLVYAGRIDKNKNIPTTLKAIELLREEGWNATLTVVGKVEDEKEYGRIVSSPYVKYISPQPKEKLINIYRDSDIFVMPSFTESFGLVYAEAMSQGLPVIYTRGQGFDGQFPEGEVGYHVDANSPNSVAVAITRIAGDYDIISKMIAEKSLRFNWVNIVKAYAELYINIV